MPMTSPPMGSDTPAGSPLSDARALEQLFRSRFTELTEEAKQQLDTAAAAAPKVVESAFRHAWEEREHLRTSDELDQFLHEDVRHGAAREKSRRASLHRHEIGGGAARTSAPQAQHAAPGPPDVEQSWSHVAHALHLVDGSSAVAESAALMRHDAAGHVADMAKKRSWKLPVAFGLVAAVAIAAGIWYVDRLGDEGAIRKALASADARTHVAATAQLAIVTLDDGSRVTLTPESKLVVPKEFGARLRAVRLDGTANFTVAPNQPAPFEVRAGSARMVAAGTAFTVHVAPADSTVVVQVTEGTVRAGIGDSLRAVAKGEALAMTRAGAMRAPTPNEIAEATSWRDHVLTLYDRQLRNVLPQLKRWYGLDIKVLDLPLLDRTLSMSVSLDSPKEAIAAVEKGANVKFGYEEKTMVFRDAAPPPKAARAPTKRK